MTLLRCYQGALELSSRKSSKRRQAGHKSQKDLPPKFKLGHRIALDTPAGDVIGEIKECDLTHAVMVSDLDNTIRYRLPHEMIKRGKVRFL